jgi:hypothetical protein
MKLVDDDTAYHNCCTLNAMQVDSLHWFCYTHQLHKIKLNTFIHIQNTNITLSGFGSNYLRLRVYTDHALWQTYQQSSSSKSGRMLEGNDEFGIRSIFVHTSK